MKQALNFSWQFIPDYKDEYLNNLPNSAETINIPHCAKEVPYNYFDERDYQFVSTYQKVFDVEEDIKDKVVKLVFDGYMLKAKIYLNGKNLGEHISGYVKVETDVSDCIKQKGNKLLVILDSREDKLIPPFGYAVDYLTFSGIYREVSLEVHPKDYLENIFIKSDVEGNVEVSYDKIGNPSVKHSLYLGDKLVGVFESDSFKVEKPELWDINNPVLYTLVTNVNGDEYVNKFGFRSAVFKPDGFYLNGRKLKLVGLNRHQSYPFVGYAMPKAMQEEDADILKYELGVNVVRQSHYPQSEHFLNRCDEIGLLTVNEIPGWQHIGQEKEWRDQFIVNLQKMVIIQRNHPSLIAHGVRVDESQDDNDLYSKANNEAHKLDPTRQTLGVRNFKNSELLEDIYAYNDFSCDSMKIGLINPKSVKSKGKPYLVSEYMGHMDPVKPTSDEIKKVEVALRHAKVIDDNFKYEKICGAIGWCAFDYHTHVDFGSGDHICPHGAYDMYRNPKHTAYIYASQSDEKPMLEVISDMKPGDYPEARYFDINVATNCDHFDLFKNDEFVARYYPKRDRFKYMPHPPILVDDLVGKTFKEKRFKEKSWPKIAKMFTHAATQGFNALSISEKLYLAFMMAKYKVSYAELVDYYNTHVGSWGGIAKTYTFKGYKNDQLVVTKKVGPSKKFDLEVNVPKKVLENKETYDALRIQLKHVDENGSLMQYSNRIIHIESQGPIRVLGDEHQTLLGGQLSLFVFSKNEKGKAKIKLTMDEIVKEIELEVK